MNSKNSKTSKSHISKVKLADKLDLLIGERASIYYTWKNMKSSYSNNTFKISAPTWNEEFI